MQRGCSPPPDASRRVAEEALLSEQLRRDAELRAHSSPPAPPPTAAVPPPRAHAHARGAARPMTAVQLFQYVPAAKMKDANPFSSIC